MSIGAQLLSYLHLFNGHLRSSSSIIFSYPSSKLTPRLDRDGNLFLNMSLVSLAPFLSLYSNFHCHFWMIPLGRMSGNCCGNHWTMTNRDFTIETTFANTSRSSILGTGTSSSDGARGGKLKNESSLSRNSFAVLSLPQEKKILFYLVTRD